MAVLGTVEASLRRGADITDIMSAIVREGDVMQGMIERNVKWYVVNRATETIIGPFPDQHKAEVYGNTEGWNYIVSRIFPPQY